MNTTKLGVRLTFVEPPLGTRPGNEEILQEHVLGQARKRAAKEGIELSDDMLKEEVTSMPEVEGEVEEKTTWFSRDKDGDPIMWDFQLKGFFKEACWALKRLPDTASSKLKAYIKEIHGLVFVFPRKIKLVLPEGGKIKFYTRPLRGQTPQGERVSIARSEMLPENTTCEFTIEILSPHLIDAIEEWLSYGKFKGLFQFRTGSFGRFTFEFLNGNSESKAK